jgi:hypothetical protein
MNIASVTKHAGGRPRVHRSSAECQVKGQRFTRKLISILRKMQ